MDIKTSNIANLPSKHGKFRIKAYKQDNQEHLVIMSRDFEKIESPYVRIHSECLTGDTLGSLKCDCQNQLELALKFIGEKGGLIIYHRQEGRNIGLLNKVNAYALQDKGRDTVQANLELGFKEDERDYSVVDFIFKDLNIKSIKLITNNPKKIEYVESLGVKITQRISAITKSNVYNENYLNTKKEYFGHFL
ncbi:GTP cyclohydrolase II [Malaciobacter canalis]|jgi:GTP cyclohydrolase II|uniref:GTP cyclohydrolase-2 n=2 Tax=Malaciobacter TaxID=2321114 RepID=A0AB36ZTX5_9BACT|nr:MULTISPECIES: GTP cyclohydrolase II [Malaciobacter]PHO09894.1 GTP cyclohydrolase II [Malaciobacter canalis]PPK60256.1 GTP cyclohydrolase II [Malaciobacter marinus]QEE33512.1 GTP cyclohydrolase II [Malaciobacter canalis]SKB38766.1 GTP cyclohydrolase II [Malaciobacter marinus]